MPRHIESRLAPRVRDSLSHFHRVNSNTARKAERARSRERDDLAIDSTDLREMATVDSELTANPSPNENGHREPLVWEYDPRPEDGPTIISGINPGEVCTLYDATELSPEGGFSTIDAPHAYAIPLRERFR